MTFRHKASRKEWGEIVAEKAGPCRGCGAPAESFHHLVPRSLAGDDVAENVIPLCGDGVRGCHGRIENREPVPLILRPEELAYVLDRKSEVFFSRYYPEAQVAR